MRLRFIIMSWLFVLFKRKQGCPIFETGHRQTPWLERRGRWRRKQSRACGYADDTGRSVLRGVVMALGLGASFAPMRAYADDDPLRMAAARRWVVGEFTPSTLTVDEQMAEMAFFIRAAEPFRGQQILRRLGDAGQR